jgi:uncharacterized membrane protein (DUF4010 family)
VNLALGEIFANLGIALGIGLLIGIQRGWTLRDQQAGTRVAGVRSFGLLGLLGGLLGILASGPTLWLAITAGIGVIALILIGYRSVLAATNPDRSMTNATAAIITLCLGILSVHGQARVAIVTAGAVVALLASRARLHAWIRSLDDTDMKATAQFAVIALVILPLLPDTNFGPFGAINLRNLWLVVVFVTGLSFAGYWASKRLGTARGTLAAATIGATYSSTAITAELARRLRAPQDDEAVLRAGIAAATAVMLLRVLMLTGILVPQGFVPFAIIVAPAAVVAGVIAIRGARRVQGSASEPLPGRNPFALGPAIGFAAMVGVIVLASKWAIARFGDAGLATILGLTGLYDVDSAIITVGNLGSGILSPTRSGLLLAVPILVNTVLKGVIVVALAGPKRGAFAALPLGLTAVVLSAGLLAWG